MAFIDCSIKRTFYLKSNQTGSTENKTVFLFLKTADILEQRWPTNDAEYRISMKVKVSHSLLLAATHLKLTSRNNHDLLHN